MGARLAMKRLGVKERPCETGAPGAAGFTFGMTRRAAGASNLAADMRPSPPVVNRMAGMRKSIIELSRFRTAKVVTTFAENAPASSAVIGSISHFHWADSRQGYKGR